MTVVETNVVFDLMVWGAAIGGLVYYSYYTWLDYHRKQLEFKLYVALAILAFFIANIFHILNSYLFDSSDLVWRVASMFDGLTLLCFSLVVSIFMEFERPKNVILPGLSIVLVLTVLGLPEITYAKLVGYVISAIVIISIFAIYVNMARVSVGAIRTKAMFFAIGIICLLLGRLLRSSLVVGVAIASPITVLGGFVVLLGLVLLAHS